MLHGLVRGPAGQEQRWFLPVQPQRAHHPVVKAEVVPMSAQSRLCRPPRYADLLWKFLVSGGERADEVGIITGPRGRRAGGQGRDSAPASSWEGRRAGWLALLRACPRGGRRRTWWRCPRGRG